MMIDRCSNKVWLHLKIDYNPWTNKEITPSRCYGARHSTVEHGHPSDGVFLLLHLWVLPSRWSIPFRRSPSSLSSSWMASCCEWLSPYEWQRLQGFRVENPSGARKGGPNRRREWARPAGLGWPARLGCPFAHVGPQVIMHFSASTCTILMMSPCVQDGGSPCMKFDLLRFNPRGCSFVALQSLLPLKVISSSSWTRIRLLKCSFEFVVNPSFMSMFSYINTILPNACT
jgi:hypothetical protein